MSNIRKMLFVALMLLTLTIAQASEARDTFYIGSAQVALTQVLGPPPAPDSQAEKGKQYHYKVQAVDSSGNASAP